MKLILIANIIACVCGFIGFVYGLVHFLKPRKAIFAQMITFAVGCAAFGRLYQVVRLLTGSDIFHEFQLGVLGVIGSLMFLFSANFGAMDSLADDRSKAFVKHRLLAFAAPVAAAVFYLLFVFLTELPTPAKIISAVITVFVMQASYYHLKHLILPDVDYGIIKCLRLYNLLALVYALLCIAEMTVICTDNEIGILIAEALLGAVLIAMILSVERGMKKWTT